MNKDTPLKNEETQPNPTFGLSRSNWIVLAVFGLFVIIYTVINIPGAKGSGSDMQLFIGYNLGIIVVTTIIAASLSFLIFHLFRKNRLATSIAFNLAIIFVAFRVYVG